MLRLLKEVYRAAEPCRRENLYQPTANQKMRSSSASIFGGRAVQQIVVFLPNGETPSIMNHVKLKPILESRIDAASFAISPSDPFRIALRQTTFPCLH